MIEPKWIGFAQVCRIHDEQLVLFDGPFGLRDAGLLESALDRPRNKYAYGERDLALLGAAYGFGITRNHPFIDGNKRTGFLAMMAFLDKNDHPFKPSQSDATEQMLKIAAGVLTEPDIAAWIRSSPPSRRRRR
jgi:death on curing protein